MSEGYGPLSLTITINDFLLARFVTCIIDLVPDDINICVLHVDLWDSISVEKGWNGLLDDWIEGGSYNEEDLELDNENITSLKIKGTHPKTGNEVIVNFVDTHGPDNKSTLHIIKAIWDNAWKDTVAENKDTSIFILPKNNEYFNSWDELLVWANSKNDSTKGNNETP